MIGLPIEMPENCEACPCCDDYYKCGATGNLFEFDEWTKRADDCPLVDLSLMCGVMDGKELGHRNSG